MRKNGDALGILYDEFFGGDRNHADLQEARRNYQVAREIRRLRREAGLTQKQLAARVGTSHSVISQLEDEDYEGHSLSMLRRVASALNFTLDVSFRELESDRHATAVVMAQRAAEVLMAPNAASDASTAVVVGFNRTTWPANFTGGAWGSDRPQAFMDPEEADCYAEAA